MTKLVSRNRGRARARAPARDRNRNREFVLGIDYEHEHEHEHEHAKRCLTNPGQDWLQEEGPCEIQPVGARHLSAGLLRAPAARDSGLNCNQRRKERKLRPGEQKLTAVS